MLQPGAVLDAGDLVEGAGVPDDLRRGVRPGSGWVTGQRFAGGFDGGAFGGVQVLLDPGDAAVTDLQVHRGVELDLGAVGQAAAQDVLLQHPVGRGHPPDDVVAQAGHHPVQASQDLQVVLDGLLDQVIVMPDDGVRSVDLAQRVDVTGFQRGEEADDEFLADSRALLPSGPSLKAGVLPSRR